MGSMNEGGQNVKKNCIHGLWMPLILLQPIEIYGLSHFRSSDNNRSAAVINSNTYISNWYSWSGHQLIEYLTYKWHHDLHVHRKYMSRPFHKDNTT